MIIAPGIMVNSDVTLISAQILYVLFSNVVGTVMSSIISSPVIGPNKHEPSSFLASL